MYLHSPNESSKIVELIQQLDITIVKSIPHGTPYLTCNEHGLILIWDKNIFQMNLMSAPYRSVSTKARHLLLEALPQENNLFIIDATAGLLRDAWLCAQTGHRVWAYEHNPLLAALVLDNQCKQKSLWLDNLTFVHNNSLSALRTQHPDVVLIDPMFVRRKQKTKPDRYLQTIQSVASNCEQPLTLLETALDVASKRVILKRHKDEPVLLPKRLNHQRHSKKSPIRLDIYQK